jgi:stress-induced morphogen
LVPETWMKHEKKQQLLWRSTHIASKVQCVDNEDIHQLNKAGNTSYDCQVISEFFNNHFVSTAEKTNNAAVQNNSNSLDYLS